MNDYIIDRLLLDLNLGLRVVLITTNVADVFRQLADRAAAAMPDCTITRTHGKQRITTAHGGLLLVRSARESGDGLRGLAVDVVLVDATAVKSEHRNVILMHAGIATMSSPRGGTVLEIAIAGDRR